MFGLALPRHQAVTRILDHNELLRLSLRLRYYCEVPCDVHCVLEPKLKSSGYDEALTVYIQYICCPSLLFVVCNISISPPLHIRISMSSADDAANAALISVYTDL